MEIDYTDYSEMKIAKRKLSKAQVESVLKSPEKVIEGKKGRLLQHTIHSLKDTGELYGNCIRSRNRHDGY